VHYQEPANTDLGRAGTGWILWDITTQVQQMYADSNNRFLLYSEDEPTRQRQVFSSRTVVMDEPADHVDAHDSVPSRALVLGRKPTETVRSIRSSGSSTLTRSGMGS
jgi:hypothetical protein